MASDNPSSSNAVAGALAYPSGGGSLEPAAEQPRQPRTLQGLLRFAMEATKAEDAPGNPQLGPMDEERRRFLDEALNAHTVRIDEILKRNIEILTDEEKISSIKPDDDLPQDVEIAFQELGEYIDDIDVANDFERMGGFTLFPLCYASDNCELRRRANLTLALVCQGNPRCQERARRCALAPVLLQRLREGSAGGEDRSVRALSSMIRNYSPATREFLTLGGCEALVGAIAGGREAPSAAFLATHLCRTSGEARELFLKTNIIQTIADTLKESRSDATEHLLSALATLVEARPDAAAACRAPGLGLRRALLDHLATPDVANGRFAEEKEHCERILKVAFEDHVGNGDDEGGVEAADR